MCLCAEGQRVPLQHTHRITHTGCLKDALCFVLQDCFGTLTTGFVPLHTRNSIHERWYLEHKAPAFSLRRKEENGWPGFRFSHRQLISLLSIHAFTCSPHLALCTQCALRPWEFPIQDDRERHQSQLKIVQLWLMRGFCCVEKSNDRAVQWREIKKGI